MKEFLNDEFKIKLSKTTIYKMLKKINITFKKAKHIFSKRNTE